MYLKQFLQITQQIFLHFLCPLYTITMYKSKPKIIFQEDNVIIVIDYRSLHAVRCHIYTTTYGGIFASVPLEPELATDVETEIPVVTDEVATG